MNEFGIKANSGGRMSLIEESGGIYRFGELYEK